MDITLTPAQQTVLKAALDRNSQIETDLAVSKQYVQGLILMLMGHDGKYTLMTEETPWRIITNEMAQDPVAGAKSLEELGAAAVDSD